MGTSGGSISDEGCDDISYINTEVMWWSYCQYLGPGRTVYFIPRVEGHDAVLLTGVSDNR